MVFLLIFCASNFCACVSCISEIGVESLPKSKSLNGEKFRKLRCCNSNLSKITTVVVYYFRFLMVVVYLVCLLFVFVFLIFIYYMFYVVRRFSVITRQISVKLHEISSLLIYYNLILLLINEKKNMVVSYA